MYRIPVKRKPEKAIVQERTAVVCLTRGCGTSFVAGVLACRLAAMPAAEKTGRVPCTLAELGLPYFADALGADKRFASEGFTYYEDALGGKRSLLTVKNEYRGMNLMLRRSGAEGMASASCALRMPGEQVVFDLSGADDTWLDEVLADMDRIVVVADPLPSRLLSGAKRLLGIRAAYPDAEILINKMNKGVNRPELRRYLGPGHYQTLPFADPAAVCRAEYSCVLPAELPELSALLKETYL